MFFLMFFILLVGFLLKLQTSSDQEFSHVILEEESDIITESGSQKYFADFHALLTKPSCREVSVTGRIEGKVLECSALIDDVW